MTTNMNKPRKRKSLATSKKPYWLTPAEIEALREDSIKAMKKLMEPETQPPNSSKFQ
ncbi:hypothetical protein [uncultured Marinobacter sp.]|jgi:hypothetical protein|uniref:hypothetical protein n=1 Tax=uncultured Marinobacter sp. TaxID=187379 RepID=UPI0025847B61|nr:hypothetical protein [uncultured Marinobacter sp.]|tara:strand:- start:144 stop:314 length:171 start_codon:yes stop_codon:yes gene_type:complete